MGSNSSLGALALTFVILETGRHLQVQRHVEGRSLSRLTSDLIESLTLPKALRDIHSRNIGNFKSPGGKEKMSLNNPWPSVSLFAPGQRSLEHSCRTPSEQYPKRERFDDVATRPSCQSDYRISTAVSESGRNKCIIGSTVA